MRFFVIQQDVSLFADYCQLDQEGTGMIMAGSRYGNFFDREIGKVEEEIKTTGSEVGPTRIAALRRYLADLRFYRDRFLSDLGRCA